MDGADPGILRRVMHKAPREVLEDYTSVSFEVLCREVLKLRFGAVLGAAEPQKHETPGNHWASGGFSQRGVRDLNP